MWSEKGRQSAVIQDFGAETSGKIHLAYQEENTWVRIRADLKSDMANMGAV
jgi:hypothetical protein